jgi:hypothetical protein
MVVRDGWKCLLVVLPAETDPDGCFRPCSPTDFILAACDVEGNFLVVKVWSHEFIFPIPELCAGVSIHRSVVLHAPRRVSQNTSA